jgi:hypothetical protein
VAAGLAVQRGDASEGALLFVARGLDKAAKTFRADLLLAGVKRAELHGRGAAGQHPIRLHDFGRRSSP